MYIVTSDNSHFDINMAQWSGSIQSTPPRSSLLLLLNTEGANITELITHLHQTFDKPENLYNIQICAESLKKNNVFTFTSYIIKSNTTSSDCNVALELLK